MLTMKEEAEQWRAVAEKIEQHGLRFGLCYETRYVFNEGQMAYRAEQHMTLCWRTGTSGTSESMYLEEPGKRGARVLAAYFLAFECEEEAKV
jgi:hypothetical protein